MYLKPGAQVQAGGSFLLTRAPSLVIGTYAHGSYRNQPADWCVGLDNCLLDQPGWPQSFLPSLVSSANSVSPCMPGPRVH